jgi:hypothetical protein
MVMDALPVSTSLPVEQEFIKALISFQKKFLLSLICTPNFFAYELNKI